MRIVLVAITVLSLSACSFFKEKVESPEKLMKHANNVELKTRWTQTVGEGLGELYNIVTPAITVDTVFANDVYGRVYAFNRDTGERKWHTHLDLDVASGVGLGDGVVYIGSLEGDVIALSQLDGEVLWRTNIASEILAPPQTNGTVLIVQTNEGKLFGLDANNGDFIWRYEAKLPLLTLRGTSTPQVFGNNLITGFSNGKIAALSAEDGVLFWERRVAYPQGITEIERVVDVDGSPVISGNTVYSTSYNGYLTAIAPNGRILWTQKASSHHSPLVVDGRVFVTSADGVLSAYDAETGLPLWNNNLLLYRKLSAPQNLSGFVVVADYRGYIHVFDPELGVIIGRNRLDSDGIRSPMISDGTYLYVLGNDGELSSTAVYLRGSRKELEKLNAEEEAERQKTKD
ncbi:MAG: outer membrane protein assembly factor BamB [Candidatus Endobugula sp.]|jgi:outer membrane protein assembly factor BamB